MIKIDKIKQLAQEQLEQWISIRRHLHQYPELSFEEWETANYIASCLDRWGISYQRGMVKTGIFAQIEGKNPAAACITLRADIDALPIQEQTGLPFSSKNEGRMHACGHDVHTTSLLATAFILHELRGEFEGRVQLIFQPGEELLPGGASQVLAEGWLDQSLDFPILGQHVEPGLPAGQVGFHPGPFMASADELYLSVYGQGGHAARPQDCNDVVLIASHLVVALQQLISRFRDPLQPSVLSFGKMNTAGGATNVLPERIDLEGTFRAFNEEWRAEAHQKMQQLCQQMAQSMGGRAELEIRKGYPYLHNEENLTQSLMQAAQDYVGKDNLVLLPQRMGAEDFGFYAQQMPACFYRLGTGIGLGLHHPKFSPDEKTTLPLGAGLMAYLALFQLNQQIKKA